jgi:hypothetical protein
MIAKPDPMEVSQECVRLMAGDLQTLSERLFALAEDAGVGNCSLPVVLDEVKRFQNLGAIPWNRKLNVKEVM